MSRRNDAPLQGQLAFPHGDFDVPDLILAICENARTGRLDFKRGDTEKKVYVRDGRIVFAASSSPDDRLGMYLIGRSELRLADLQRLSPRVRPGVRLGTLLVQHGILTPDALVHAVLGQVESIILSLFHWTEASYAFVAEEPTKDEAITLNIPTARIIVNGVESVTSWQRISNGVESLDATFVGIAGHEVAVRSVDLDKESLELLAMLAQPRSVEEVCESSDLPDILALKRLWAFRVLGWIRDVPDDEVVEPQPRTDEMDADLEGLGMILRDDPLESGK